MTVTYRPADAAKRIGEKLIPEHHKDLVDVRIEYVFRSETAKAKGREIWGRARKMSGLNAYLAQELDPDETPAGEDVDFFVLEFSEPVWAIIGDKERRALVDHELCHLRVEQTEDGEEVKLVIVPHDVEEFRDVIERHGLWRDDVKAFAEVLEGAAGQRSIDDALTDPDAP